VIADLVILQDLKANNNVIRSTQPLKNHKYLSSVDISYNQIQEISNISVLSTISLLRTLMIRDNPIENSDSKLWTPKTIFTHHPTATYPPSFRLFIIHLVPRLLILNCIPTTPEEKVAATNTYSPSTDVVLSIQHMNQQRAAARAYTKIKAEDFLRAKRLIPIVLCGPNGVGKR
jgi:Leucine-rich repeat (LRR) protein